MKKEDIKFCQEHIINFESVSMGFTRNIDFSVLGEYERMYKEYLDPQFSLTYWCGECVFDMLKRLIKFYELSLAQVQDLPDTVQEIEQVIEEEKVEAKKKRRTKK